MSEPEVEIATKRFYVPGYVLRSPCPKCGQVSAVDFEREYLSYPTANKPFDRLMYCAGCDHEWNVKVLLTVKLELLP